MTIERTPGGLDRRRILKTAVAASAMTVASPFVMRGALGSSGELNFIGWAGYDGFPTVFKAFEAKTGIKVKFTGYGSQDEIVAQAKTGAATNGSFDISEPTVDRLPSWIDNDFLRPWDDRKLGLDGVEAAFMSGQAADMMMSKAGRMAAPSVWGTESIMYNTRSVKMEVNKTKLLDLFDDKYAGKVTMRGHSGLAAIGRGLEAAGQLPHKYADAYTDEAKMTAVYDAILKYALTKRKNIGQFWSNENEAQGAFRTNGCVVGCNWDTTAGALMKEGFPVAYISPAEGAFAWLENFVLLKGARNIEQAHAWVSYINTAEGSALWAKAYAGNPTAKGAVDKLDDAAKKFFQAAYPGDALKHLFWWPATQSWFVAKRTEYAKKLQSA